MNRLLFKDCLFIFHEMTAFRGLAPNSLECYSSGFRRLRFPTGVGHFIPISVEKVEDNL